MKCYPSRPRLQKLLGVSAGLRALLVVALLTLLACLPLYVLAQTETETAQTRALATDKSASNSEVFVIYRDQNGESICRKATLAEKEQLRERNGAGPANTIYPGGRRLKDHGSNSPTMTETGTALLPSSGLRIVLHATTQLQNNPVARDAFIVAANRWEALVSTPITVVLDVDFGTTFFGQPWGSSSILGATGTANTNIPLPEVRTRLISNSPTAEELALYNALPTDAAPVELNGSTTSASTVRTTFTVARAIGFVPDIGNPDSLPIGQGDAGIGFNSAHTFDFDPADGISAGTLDFDAVVVHEIGHALGFTSRSGAGPSSPLSMWDLYRFRPGAASLATVGTAPRVMSMGGEQVFFNNHTNSFGSLELQLSTGGPEGAGGDGGQSSHWQDDRIGVFIGIMDPTLQSGQRETITSNDLNALDTFGYAIGGTVPPPPPPPPPPVNDNFSAAITLNASSGSITGTNLGATGETGEPNHAGVSGLGRRSVWYNWVATANALVEFNTSGSNYDTVLAVYEGNAVNSLNSVAANDDVQNGVIQTSRVTFHAQVGRTYRIAVAGFLGDTGNITLNWFVPEPRRIAGRVTNEDGSPFGGLQISLSGFFQPSMAITNANGDYAFNNLEAGLDYRVEPSFQGGLTTFTPPFQTFTNLQTDQTANFVRKVFPTFRVSGRVTNESGAGMAGIQITVPGATTPVGGFPILPTSTDADGYYAYDLAAGRNYNITPNTFGYTYTPAVVSITNLSANQTANFVTSRPIYNIVGRVLENGVGLADVTMSVRLGPFGPTVTTSSGADGVYRFVDVPLVSNYTVSAQKFSYTFFPQAQFLGSVFQGPVDIEATRVHPIETSDFFVRQHYLDFLNRVGDTNGVQFWVTNIDQCGTLSDCRSAKRVDTSAAFFLSIEFQETGYLVYRFYKSAYGNIPGAPVPVRLAEFLPDTQRVGQGVQVGVGNWQALLEANKQAFAMDFVTRARFTSAFATTLTPAQFVDALFAKAAVTPSANERNAAIAEFGAATNTASNNARARAVRLVAENSQLKTLELNKAFVLMQYFGYLRRNPNDAPEVGLNFDGYNFWLNKLNQFHGNFADAEMVKAFILSGEYRARFP